MKLKSSFIFIIIILLLLLNIVKSSNNEIKEKKNIEYDQEEDKNINNNENNDDEEDSLTEQNKPTFVLSESEIDESTLEFIKNLFPNSRLVKSDKNDDDDDDDDKNKEEKEEENKKLKKRAKPVKYKDISDQFQIKFSTPSSSTPKSPPKSSLRKQENVIRHYNEDGVLEEGVEEEIEDNSILFDFINDNIMTDRELPGRELLIEAQKYRGYLLYDPKTSKTHRYSNSIMIHGFDLSPDRDLFEFKGQSNLTPLNPEKAYKLLLDSANLGNHRAMYLLGIMNEIGENNNEIMNFTNAEEWYLKSAEYGNSDAQRSLGFLYSTGKLGYIDEAKAILYYTFSARSGNIVSQLTMAYRYLYGHGVEKNCKKSSILYSKVASRVVEDYEHRGFGYQIHSQRFSEDRKQSHGYQDESDIVDYLKYSSDDPYTMGRLYLEGSLVSQDFQQAFDYFKRASIQGLAGGYSGLGFMYNMGYGVEQSNKTAFEYYLKASDLGDRDSKSNLAELYFNGYGVKQNIQKAIDIWLENSEYHIDSPHSHAISSVKGGGVPPGTMYHGPSNAHLGRIYAYGLGGQGIDRIKASHYFSRAISGGDITSFYHFAKIHLDRDELSCPLVIQYMKKIAEKGAWAIILSKAQDLYEENDEDRALLLSEKAAEMGFEMAQYNAAWMYDKRLGLSSYYKQDIVQSDFGNRIEDEIVDIIIGEDNTVDTAIVEEPINEEFNEEFWDQQSFRYYDYSAEQHNPVSRIKIGDYFYYGRGIEENLESAAESYKEAANYNQPMALFNLGYLYQWGLGVPQDLFLAKRYYDLSLHYQPKGYIPIYISLIGLLFHFIYIYICSIFDPSIKLVSTGDTIPNIATRTTTTSTTTTTTHLPDSHDNSIIGNILTFDNELIRQLESYTMIFFVIVIGFLVVRRQRIILNQQRHPQRQQQQQHQQQRQQ